jgi:hypothetical protein
MQSRPSAMPCLMKVLAAFPPQTITYLHPSKLPNQCIRIPPTRTRVSDPKLQTFVRHKEITGLDQERMGTHRRGRREEELRNSQQRQLQLGQDGGAEWATTAWGGEREGGGSGDFESGGFLRRGDREVGRRLAPAVLHGGCFGLGSGTWRGNTPGGETEERETGGIGMRGDTDGKRYRRRRGGDGRQELKRRPFRGTVLVVQLAQFFSVVMFSFVQIFIYIKILQQLGLPNYFRKKLCNYMST